MAAREFTIHFVNDTSFRLELQGSPAYLQGEWSEGMAPPATVEPHATVHWKSESDGFWTGTEGEVAYRPLRGTSKEGGSNGKYPDIAIVHWNNPYVGATDSAPRVQLDNTPVPGSGGAAPVQAFALEGGGARNMGTFPGVGVSGWIDLVPGVLPTPFPNDPRAINHAWAQFRLSTIPGRSIVPADFVPLPASTKSYEAAVGAPSDAWVGSWQSSDGESRIVTVHITKSAPPPLTWPGREPRFDVQANENLRVIASRFQLSQSRIAETQVMVERYTQDFLANPKLGQRVSNTQSKLASLFGMEKQVKPIAGVPSSQQRRTAMDVVLSRHNFVDALELQGNLCLGLYVRTELPSGAQGYSVRYMKRTTSGELVADLMLEPRYMIK